MNWTKVELRPIEIVKLFFICYWFELNQSGIETLMGNSIKYTSSPFELNQSGIETETTFASYKLFSNFCLNWTKVELRLPVLIDGDPHRYCDGFELNQSGIETFISFSTCLIVSMSFELNQSGIETLGRFLPPPCPRLQFELNQSGIETVCSSYDGYGVVIMVWIEPKWNWDLWYLSHPYLKHKFCLNWTKVELRPPPDNIMPKGAGPKFELNQSEIEIYTPFLNIIYIRK